MSIEYANRDKSLPMRERPVKRHGDNFQLLPGQSEEGYGKKITTDREVQYKGRWYRVYATCFSNAASHWIMVNKQKLHLLTNDI
jgi:hypothetical protein